MSCNAFDIRISLYKSLEDFFLLFTVRLEWNTILYITCGMIFFIFPDVVRLDSKKNIYVWKTDVYKRQAKCSASLYAAPTAMEKLTC